MKNGLVSCSPPATSVKKSLHTLLAKQSRKVKLNVAGRYGELLITD
jgi:hypothetical protein